MPNRFIWMLGFNATALFAVLGVCLFRLQFGFEFIAEKTLGTTKVEKPTLV